MQNDEKLKIIDNMDSSNKLLSDEYHKDFNAFCEKHKIRISIYKDKYYAIVSDLLKFT